MDQVFVAVKSAGFWLRVCALVVNLGALTLWLLYQDLPLVSHLQLVLFYHAVAGYTVILTGLTIVLLLEPLGEFTLRIFSMAGGCLFTVTGMVGFINYLAYSSHYGWPALLISLLCLLVSALLTADVLTLECGRTMERIDAVREPPFHGAPSQDTIDVDA